MANYNKVILIGNLTRDPQLSYLPSETPVVEFGLAVNRNWKGQDGQRRDETCFIDVRAYGKQAEVLNHYMAKGRPILVEGRLQFDQWVAQDGTKRSRHRVIVENFQFLGSRGEAAPDNAEAAPDNAKAQVAPPVRTQQSAPPPPPSAPPAVAAEPQGSQVPPENSDAPPPPAGEDIPF